MLSSSACLPGRPLSSARTAKSRAACEAARRRAGLLARLPCCVTRGPEGRGAAPRRSQRTLRRRARAPPAAIRWLPTPRRHPPSPAGRAAGKGDWYLAGAGPASDMHAAAKTGSAHQRQLLPQPMLVHRAEVRRLHWKVSRGWREGLTRACMSQTPAACCHSSYACASSGCHLYTATAHGGGALRCYASMHV